MHGTRKCVGIITVIIAGFTAQSTLRAGTCTINAAETYQTIDGFGFSSAWSGQLTSAQGATLFGTGAGQLGFSLLRVRIDPNENWSTETANAALAHSYGAKVLGTPWTPPADLKSNNNTIGGTLNTSEYAAYATYLNSAASSLGLDYVSMQNEPDANVNYESCSWTGTTMETWCQTNAPTVGKPIVMPESQSFNDTYSDPTLNNATAVKNIAIVAGHIYGGGNIEHENALNHGKHVWMTEHYNNGTDIGTALTDAKEVSDCINNEMSAYFWWYAFYPGAACDLVNGSVPQLNGYALAQFAHFIRPGYINIGTTYNPTTNVYVTAYTGQGTVVIVAINLGTTSVSQPFTLQNITVPYVTPTTTSASSNMVAGARITVAGGAFTDTLPAQSVTTFVSGIANGTYKIINLNSGSSLNVDGAGTANGTDCSQWAYDDVSQEQWTVTSIGNGEYEIVGVGSGKSLNVSGASKVNGGQVSIWTYVGAPQEQWTFTPTNNGNYIVTSVNSGLVLEVSGASKANGANVDQWTSNSGTNQEWSFQAP